MAKGEEEKNGAAKPKGEKGDKGDRSDKGPKLKVSDFDFGEVLGEGAYGAVVLGTDKKTGQRYAVKMLEKKHIVREGKVKYVTTERDILTKCEGCPFIIRLFATFKDSDYLYYVMELASNGELLGALKRVGAFELTCATFYTAEMVLALEQLHDVVGVIHRDFKPENVLLDAEMHVKLTDFGTAKLVGLEKRARAHSFVGTAEYIAPEMLQDEKFCCKASDLWALGCTIYQLICGRPPFRGVTEFLTLQKVAAGAAELVFPEGFPDVARDLVQRLLVREPEQRLGAGDYSALKAHAFFEGIQWEQLHAQRPPPIVAFAGRLVFPEDIEAEEKARLRKLQDEERRMWQRFLLADERILESGLVWKRRKMSIKKRQLILTDTPRLIYIDPKTMKQKGEMPWSSALKVETKNEKNFFIHTPKRTYILQDADDNSARWQDAITKIL